MRRLRGVLRRCAAGMGVSAAFVAAFSGSGELRERDAVRRVLLGWPVEAASKRLTEESGTTGALLRFLLALSRFSAVEAGRSAEALSPMFDRWALARQRRAAEEKVMAFRGLIVSLVAGVVVGMLASMAPLLTSFQLALGAVLPTGSGFQPVEGAALLVPSSLCLGYYLSPGRPYVDLAVSLAAFAGVIYLMGPLVSL